MAFDQTAYQIMVTNSLTRLIMEHLDVSAFEALETFLNSETYRMVCQPELDMWELAPLEIHSISEVMKLTNEFEFFIYLLQRYAQHKNKPAPEILKLWNETLVRAEQRLTDFIMDMYFMYHQEALTNAFMDIDHLIETGLPYEPEIS